MRRFRCMILAGMLVLCMSVPVYADRSSVVKVEAPADTTDYYMTVDSGGVGVDIYPSTDRNSEKLNNSTVKDGTVLHIEGETDKNGETWGYTEYKGRYGYVPLDELRPSKDAELAKAGIADPSDEKTDGASETDSTEQAAADGQSAAAGDSKASAEVQGPPKASGADTAISPSPEEETAKPVNGTTAKSFKVDSSWTASPFIWIGIVTVLAVIGILVYHFRKH